MSTEKEKMREFVDKLWANPAMSKQPIARRESQIISFLRDNNQQLQKVFASADYFPGLSWDDAVRLLLSELIDRVFETVTPKIERINKNILNPEMLAHFVPGGVLDEDKFKNFILNQMRVKGLRDNYLVVIEAISREYFERYVGAALQSRKTIYLELVRRDRLEMEARLIPHYLNLAALFRPLWNWGFGSAGGRGSTLADAVRDPKAYVGALSSFNASLGEEIGHLPEKIWRPGVESWLKSSENPNLSGAAQIIGVVCARAADLEAQIKVDRGAETPDKSWFNIARRNAKFHGYNPRLLEDFYLIAADGGW